MERKFLRDITYYAPEMQPQRVYNSTKHLNYCADVDYAFLKPTFHIL